VRAVDDARAEFAQAAAGANNPFVRVAAWIPLAGRTPDAVRTLADVGLRTASAGAGIADAIAKLPGGFGALSLHGGRLPVTALTSLGPAIHDARLQIEAASAEAAGIATTLVPGAVVSAGDQLRAKLAQAIPVVRSADDMIANLPAFAGMTRPATYFLAPQNPTELRGTGGFISRWSLLTIDEGVMSVGPFRPITDLPNQRDPTWPNTNLAAIFGPYNAAGFWRSTNVPRDGPTASLLETDLWSATARQPAPLDGVIMVDVQALAEMVGAIGKVHVTVGGHPYALTKENVVPFISSRAYRLYADQTIRKDAVGIAGQRIFAAFLQRASSRAALQALIQAAGDGHILVNATDPALEAALTEAGTTGSLGPSPSPGPSPGGGDFFGASVVNTAGTKVDYYIHRRIAYDVTIEPDGRAQVRATVSFRNDAPAGAKPGYVLGPYPSPDLAPYHLGVGEAFQSVFLYFATGCTASGIQKDGRPFAMSRFTERGLSLYRGSMRIPAQTSSSITMDLTVPSAWTGSAGQGTYRLALQDQPTINPTLATVTIHIPSGTQVAYASDGVTVDGGVATWSGPVGDLSRLEIRFQRGFLGRTWSGLRDFLSKPVFRIGG
jgi:hypothetical protein